MAQNITIMGASYTDVPSVILPKTGGGTAEFMDTSDADATANDLFEGKTAYVNGVKLIGTGTGGGPIIMGVLRPDAELVETWAYDKMLVADEGISLPSAYSTTSQTLKTTANIATYDGTPTTYRYFITQRCLTIPVYNITTLAKGREEYVYSVYGAEWIYQPQGELCSLDGSKSYGQYSQIVGTGAFSREVLWTSATALTVYTSPAYCLAQNIQAPTITSNKTITIKSPTITMRGHATYLTQTFFEAITDARIQYVIELWRVPITDVVGWVAGSQMRSLYEDIANGGTLT